MKVEQKNLKLKELDLEKKALLNGDNILRIVKEAYNFCATVDGKKKLVSTMLSTMMSEDVRKDKCVV